MSNDNNKTTKPVNPRPVDVTKTDEAAKDEKRSATEREELDEGLEESFPGSDAPASTRRSERD